MDAVLTLISQKTYKNEFGVSESIQTSRDVFCRVVSVTRTEFFEGGRNGLNPEYQFTVFSGDYDGETLCEYNGNSYGIYRVYRTDDDYIELYAERKGGTNGKAD